VSISHRFSLGVFGEEKLRADNVTVRGVNGYWKAKKITSLRTRRLCGEISILDKNDDNNRIVFCSSFHRAVQEKILKYRAYQKPVLVNGSNAGCGYLIAEITIYLFK